MITGRKGLFRRSKSPLPSVLDRATLEKLEKLQ